MTQSKTIRRFEQKKAAKIRRVEKEKARRNAFEVTRAAVKRQVQVELQYFDLARAGFFLMWLAVLALAIYFGLQVFAK